MTIMIGAARAAEIAALGRARAPILAWENLCAPELLTTGLGDEVSGWEAANAGTGTNWDAWSALADETGTVTLDLELALATGANFAGIASHNLGDLGASVTVQYSTDGGSSWTDTEAGVCVCSDNSAVTWIFTEVSAADWRLHVSGLSVDEQVYLAVLQIGGSLILPQPIYQGYAPPVTPTNVALKANVSEGAKLLGTAVERTGSTVSVPVKLLREAEARALPWRQFQSHFNSGGGIFWLPQPGMEEDAYFGWRGGAVLAPARSGVRDFMSADLKLRLDHEE